MLSALSETDAAETWQIQAFLLVFSADGRCKVAGRLDNPAWFSASVVAVARGQEIRRVSG
jgi:hypothetical protein